MPVEEPEQDSRPARRAPAQGDGRRRTADPARRGAPPADEPRRERRAPDPRQNPDGRPAGRRRRPEPPDTPPELPQRRPRDAEQGRRQPPPVRREERRPAVRDDRPSGPVGAELFTPEPPVERRPEPGRYDGGRRNGRPQDAAPRREPGRRRAPDGRRGAIDEPTVRAGNRTAPRGVPVEPLEPVDDVIAGPAADTEATTHVDPSSPEFPGRHRRRAGESADERPAAAYRELAAADGRKQRTGRRRRSSFWKELPLLVLVALVLTFLIQTFIAKVYVIPSGSMETTLHGCTGCNNDRVLVDKVTYRFSGPQPGDVVVFRGPDSWNSEIQIAPPSNFLIAGLQQLGSLIGLAPPDEKDFVKRVIAVGGQTVQCCTTNGQVMVDGKPLNEPYIYYLPGAGEPRQQAFGPVTVPQGELWMMGDSRNNSADSRIAGHGAVPVANVIGKARLIVLPFPRFGWIPSADPQNLSVGLGPAGDAAGFGAVALAAALPLLRRRRRSGLLDLDDVDTWPMRRR
ncbi:signal peptidase I [Pseudonocardia sp. CA-107938]|uniref:signal peptidase I n=1 Tax=Pseudonocardia sp. CA-107938 TaxID=3240021 RepID=UPI003D932524